MENCAITEAIFLSWLHMAEINNFGRLFNGVSLDKFNTTSSASLYLVLDFVSMKTKYNSQETSHRLGFNFDYYTVTFWLSFCHIKSLKYRFLITMCLLTEWKGCRGNIQLEFRPSRVKCPCIMTESQIFSHAAYPNSSISILLFDCHSSLCPFFSQQAAHLAIMPSTALPMLVGTALKPGFLSNVFQSQCMKLFGSYNDNNNYWFEYSIGCHLSCIG